MNPRRRCAARNRNWDRCELEYHAEQGGVDHWSLESGVWSETLAISGDSHSLYLSDEQGRIVATRRDRPAGARDVLPGQQDAMRAPRDAAQTTEATP